ncbi:MAG: PQQ-binding-like beta-propeller repeat protein [Verrucomicrobiales bacterium]
MSTRVIAGIACLFVSMFVSPIDAQADTVGQLWPGFRGIGGNGHAVDAHPPVSWSAADGKNVLWKTAIARHGMSSPVVVGKRLFVTAADHVVRQVLCYDTDTGKLVWEHGVDSVAGEDLPRVLDETGYAAPTAVTNGDLVAAMFATGELVCVNVEGNRVWEKQLGVPKNHYGHASSLARFESLVIVQVDQEEDARLLAFDFASGKPVWQVERDAMSWSSPIVIDNNGRMEVILTNSKCVDSYDPKTGTHLWRVDCIDGEVAPSAAYADGVAFVASEGATATAIALGKHDPEPKILWQWAESLPDSASPLATKQYLILPTAFGLVTCLNAKNGEVYWEHEYDRGFSSSPILVNDCVYLADLSGTMQIFRMGKEFEHVGEGSIGEAVYATPAFVGDRIYIRGVAHLFCIANQEKADGDVPNFTSPPSNQKDTVPR